MRGDTRRKEICEILQVQHSIAVAALAERFGVCAMTIRRDLDMLEEQNMLHREHGRAVYRAPYSDVEQYESRLMRSAAKKKHIAKIALAFLHGIRTIYLDGSTTCTAFLELVPMDLPLTVYTNSIPALNILIGRPRIKAYVFGGLLSGPMRCLDSTYAQFRRNEIFVDAAFISCTGYDASSIISHDLLPVNERRMMLKNAAKRYLLADSEKHGKAGPITVCGWDAIDVFITDAAPDERLAASLSKNNVTVVY